MNINKKDDRGICAKNYIYPTIYCIIYYNKKDKPNRLSKYLRSQEECMDIIESIRAKVEEDINDINYIKIKASYKGCLLFKSDYITSDELLNLYLDDIKAMYKEEYELDK